MKQASINTLAQQLGDLLLKRNLRCSVAESCTGGTIAAAITAIAGSSHWFDCGFVTYSNASKQHMLAVPASLIDALGAVSEGVVCAMAEGAMIASAADVSVAVSGIAGPGGGSVDKPVGTVWIAWAGGAQPTRAQCYVFAGDRGAVREQAVWVALDGLIERVEQCE